MFARILVAVDHSTAAERAIDTAINLAAALRAWLGVIHVVDPCASYVPELAAFDRDRFEKLQRQGNRILDAALARVPQTVRAEPILLEGDPAEVIVSAAMERNVDLIVIGSESRGRLAHFLLGSTADAVIRKASCPVVSVRAGVAANVSTEEDADHRRQNVGAG